MLDEIDYLQHKPLISEVKLQFLITTRKNESWVNEFGLEIYSRQLFVVSKANLVHLFKEHSWPKSEKSVIYLGYYTPHHTLFASKAKISIKNILRTLLAQVSLLRCEEKHLFIALFFNSLTDCEKDACYAFVGKNIYKSYVYVFSYIARYYL